MRLHVAAESQGCLSIDLRIPEASFPTETEEITLYQPVYISKYVCCIVSLSHALHTQFCQLVPGHTSFVGHLASMRDKYSDQMSAYTDIKATMVSGWTLAHCCGMVELEISI